MKKIKKVLISFLTLLLVCPTLPMGQTSAASSDFKIEYVTGGVKITGYTGTATNLEIPSTIDGAAVKEIGNRAFAFVSSHMKNKLTSVTIPDTVVRIGNSAFYNHNLTSITIPKNVSEIGSYAFGWNTDLERVTFKGSSINISSESLNQLNEEFMGWYTDASLDSKWDETSVPTGKELYAKRLPARPTDVTGKAGGGKAIISFTGPTHSGSNAVSEYTVKVYDGNTELTDLETKGEAAPITVTGLTNKMYKFTVSAKNKAGYGGESGPVWVTPILYDTIDNGNGVTITKYYGDETTLQIPSIINYKTVTAIGEGAFSNHRLKSVQIPKSVSTIAENAFSGNQIEQITFDGNPITIDNTAFATNDFPEFAGWYTDESLETEWDLTSVPPSGKVFAMRKPNPPVDVHTEVGDREVKVFFTGPQHTGGNAVSEYTVRVYKDGVEQEGHFKTGNASPITVTGLTHDTEYTFKVIAKNKAGDSVASNASEMVQAIEFYQTEDNSDGTVTIKKYNGTAKEVEIPGEIDGKKVTGIGEQAFYSLQLTSVTIPESVTRIGKLAFARNMLTNITIPQNVSIIGHYAFQYNELTSVSIPNSVEVIEGAAFGWNKLTDVIIPENVTFIGPEVFINNQLTSVIIPESVTSIGFDAFRGNHLEEIIFEGTPKIGVNAFVSQSAAGHDGWYVDTTFETPWSDQQTPPAGGKAYAKRIPNSPLDVKAKAGDEEALVTFTGPMHAGGNVVTSYTVKVYVDGTETKELETIGTTSPITVKGLTNGTSYAFKVIATNAAGDSELSEASTPIIPLPTYMIADNDDGTVSITGYNGSEKNIVIPSKIGGKSVTAIKGTAFQSKDLSSVTIPDSVLLIESYAFANNKLMSVEIPKTVTSIGSYAFADNKLTNVTIPDSINLITTNAFANNQLTSVEIPESVTRIESFAFANNKLTSMTIPKSVASIKPFAFTNNQLELISFKGNPEIGYYAFNGQNAPDFDGWYTDVNFEILWTDQTIPPAGGKAYTKRKPNTPTDVLAKAGDRQATVSFTGPTHIGGNAVTSYTVKVYIDGIVKEDLETTGTSSPIAVKGLTNGSTYTFRVVATNLVGNSMESVATPAVTPVATSQGGGGSSTSTDPVVEKVIVPVETGNGEQTVANTLIERTRESNGKVKDKMIFSTESAKETVKILQEMKQNTARILLPDSKDEVSEVNVIVSKEAVKELGESRIHLELASENVKIIVPETSFTDFNEELFFRILPLKDLRERKEIENRAKVESIVKDIAGEQNVNVVSRPMKIETNMQNRPITLVLPLRDLVLPAGEQEREKFLKDLLVYIEHSDGDKNIVKPQIVEYKQGQLGLGFDVDKFSTFSILNIEDLQNNHHQAYIKGYPNNTFKPNANVTRAQMAAMLARNLGFKESQKVNIPTYNDINKTHWALGAIEFVKEQGLMVGDRAGNFKPSADITRGEMAAIVSRFKKLEGRGQDVNALAFSDVEKHWAFREIVANKEAGIISGFSDGTFRPNHSLTRAQAVKMINRMFDRGPLYGATKASFKDVPVSHWAFYEIEEARQNHFFTVHPEGGENIIK